MEFLNIQKRFMCSKSAEMRNPIYVLKYILH
jgi:hypothetical protein